MDSDGRVRRCLDLFAGTGGFSAAFRDSPDWSVFTVEINSDHDPDLAVDIMDLSPSDLGGPGVYDIVLVGFPCTFMTTIRNVTKGGDNAWRDGQPATDAAANNWALLWHTLGLVRGLAPDYWILENPRGSLRTRWREPDATVWQCQYGRAEAKPTDLWGDVPRAFDPETCYRANPDCDHIKTKSYKEHGGGSDNRQALLVESDSSKRAAIPYALSEAILEAVEATPKQTTLDSCVAVPDGGGQKRERCPYCHGEGTVKRKYGTVGPGPANIIRHRRCPVCRGSGDVDESYLDFDDGGDDGSR
jgi:hypothetical protein